METLLWIAITLSLCCISYLLYLLALPKPIPHIPFNQDAANRILGDIPSIVAAKYRRHWIYTQPASHNSPIAQVMTYPFSRPVVVVSNYHEVVDILSRRTKEFDRGTKTAECIGLTAPNFHFTFESQDPRFKQHKDLLKDLMSPSFLEEAAAPSAYEQAGLLVDLWTAKDRQANGRPFAADEDLYMATLDIICNVAFGIDDGMGTLRKAISTTLSTENHLDSTVDINVVPKVLDHTTGLPTNEPVVFPKAKHDPEVDALLDMSVMTSIAQKSPFPWLSQHLALLKPKHARAWWYRRSLIKRRTERMLRRLASGGEKEGRMTVLEHLIQREAKAAEKAGRPWNCFSPVIRDEVRLSYSIMLRFTNWRIQKVLGYLLGGHDTTATALSWWVKYMSTYQTVQTRLRSELRAAYTAAAYNERWPTQAEITSTSIPYLDAVIEETLRFANTVTLIARRATCDTTVLGYHIPKGTDLYLHLGGESITWPFASVPDHLRSPTYHDAKNKIPNWEEDVTHFNPSRWLKQLEPQQQDRDNEEGYSHDKPLVTAREVFNPSAGPTLAFSSGPRQCFGKKQAYIQLKMVVTLLIWNFEFGELPAELNSGDIIEKMMNSPKDCFVKLRRVP